MNEHTHKQFDTEMEAIRSGVLAMGGLVESQLRRAIALLEADDHDAIVQVKTDEKQINQMQVSLDQMCSQIIARRQPTAIDLRFVLMISKIVNELERVGDEVKKIAYKAAETRGVDRLAHVRRYDVVRTTERAREMLQMALDTFARLDAAAAAEVIGRDEEIDAAFLAIMRQLISYMMEDPRTITPALEIVFIAKSIERIGDHAKNIAEAVVQVVKGIDVRHASADQIRAEVAGEMSAPGRPKARIASPSGGSAAAELANAAASVGAVGDADGPRRRGRARDPGAAARQPGRRGLRRLRSA